MTEQSNHVEGRAAENAKQIELQELMSFRHTLRSIQWLLPLMVVLYLFVADIFIADTLSLQISLGFYAVFMSVMQLIRWPYKNIRAILSAEIWGMILFISLILQHTGGLTSPLLSLYFFPGIATAVSLPRSIRHKLVIITVFCFFLAFSNGECVAFTRREVIATVLLIVSLWLVSCLAALLSVSMLEARRKIQQLSEKDFLTGLHNMRTFLPLARNEYARSIRCGHPFSILMIDVDHLKLVNESYGHDYGSEMIRRIGGVIAGAIRPSDIAARYGGDEFVVLLEETGSDGALLAAERLRRDVERTPLSVPEGVKSITISIGIACFPDHGVSVEELITRADEALHTSKKEGKNCATVAGLPGAGAPSTAAAAGSSVAVPASRPPDSTHQGHKSKSASQCGPAMRDAAGHRAGPGAEPPRRQCAA
jgi:diguanylate cyclase (GGDEF)-like protein